RLPVIATETEKGRCLPGAVCPRTGKKTPPIGAIPLAIASEKEKRRLPWVAVCATGRGIGKVRRIAVWKAGRDGGNGPGEGPRDGIGKSFLRCSMKQNM